LTGAALLASIGAEKGGGVVSVSDSPVLERAIRHDRMFALVALTLIALLSWTYLMRMAATMTAATADKAMHAAMGMPEMATWGRPELVMLFLMWTIMMIAMMLPSASPVILLVAAAYRRRGTTPRLLTGAFAAGYLLAWTGFSAAASSLQLALHRAAVLTTSMAAASALSVGAILVAAGVYQWLPVKSACLTHCRSPLAFLAREWRDGARGAMTMGLRHGLYCVGCCWALMMLLFAAGVMNLVWVAAIAAFVLAEKLLPRGPYLAKVAGILLVAWGAWVLVVARGA
jgi:predicted metal-binding membrane protein